MFWRSDLGVTNILISSIIFLSVYGLYLILKWYVVMRMKNRRIFKMLSHYNSPPHIPILGYALKLMGTPTQIHNTITGGYFTHGPNYVVWILDRVLLCVGKPEDVGTVLTSQSCLEKNEMYHFMRPVIGDGSIAAPLEKWRRTRKVMNPTFNTKVLEGYQPIFGRCAKTFIDEVLPKYFGKKDVDWLSHFLLLQVDALMQTSMGVDHDLQRKPNDFPTWLKYCTRSVFLRMANVLHHPDFIYFNTKLGKSLVENRDKFWEFTERIIREKRKKFEEDLKNKGSDSDLDDDLEHSESRNIGKKALLDALLDLDHRGEKFTDEDLRNELTVLFIAGTDTSAVTLCYFLMMMGMHQDIQDRVYEEVCQVFSSDGLPTVQDLGKLIYLERCLKESMRIFPAGPIMIRKNIGEDLKISDGVIPKDVSIVISPFYTQRSELYWDDPLKFDPDRFLPEQIAKRHPYTFFTFSGGPRGCVGQKYAYNNMKTILGLLMKKCRVHCDGYNSIEDIKLKSTIVMEPIHGFKFWLETNSALNAEFSFEIIASKKNMYFKIFRCL